MTVHPEQPRIFVIRDEHNRFLPKGEYLVSVWPDLVTVAHREQSWHTWSPPVTCEEEK